MRLERQLCSVIFQLDVKLKYDSRTRKLKEIGYNIIARTEHKGVITERLL